MRLGSTGRAGLLTAGAAMLALATTAWANVYPSAVRVDASGLAQPTGVLKVAYILNEDADGTATQPGVKIEVLNASNAVVRTVVIPRQKKGKHTFIWDGRDDNGVGVTHTGGNYRVKITAADFGYGSWTKISSDTNQLNKFYHAKGLDVNKNSTSPYYGRIYVCNALAGTTTGAPTRTTADGFFALEADQTDALGQGDTARTGGVAWLSGTADTGGSSPFKLTVGQDDNVYVTDYSDAHPGLWKLDPDLTAGVEVLDSTGKSAVGLNATHGSLSSVIVEGSGPTLSFVTSDEDWQSVMGYMLRYNVGTSALPFVGITNREAKLAAVNSVIDIVRGSDKKYYWTQYRLNADTSLRVFTANPATNATAEPGAVTSHYLEAGAYGYRAIAIDEARNRIAIATYATSSAFVIRDLANPGTIVSTVSVGGSRCQDITIDTAGNVYVVNSSSERLTIWSPPDNANSMSTTSPEVALTKTANGALITAQPQNVITTNNGNAVFSVSSSAPGVTYQWMREGVDLADGGIVSGATTATLTLTGVTRAADDAAVFTCRVTAGTEVEVSDPATLGIAPYVVQPPAPSSVVCQAGNGSLTVQAVGLGTLSYQWQKLVTSTWTNLTDGATISGTTTPTLTITGAATTDAGQYRVRVTDSADAANPVDSAVAVITISAGPTQTAISGNKTTTVGGAASFQCTMVGRGPLMYRWYKSIGGVETLITEGPKSDFIWYTNAQCGDNGAEIICRVTDDCGTKEGSPRAKLTVTIPAETCNNGKDDDCDGQTDCDDADCSADEYCKPPCPQPFADRDADGDVDMLDFAELQRCYALAPATYDPTCECLDYNNDTHIDVNDVSMFVACGSGPGIPANPACDDRPSGAGKVVINEFVYDVVDLTGADIADQFEFVELYNRSSETVDISGWVLRASDTPAPPADDNRDFVVPGGVGSGTTVIAPGGYYVFTSPNVAVPAANPPYLQFQTLANPTDIWDNGPDTLELLDGNRTPADTVIYRRSLGTVAVTGEGSIWGPMATVDSAAKLSVSRYYDGQDTDNNGRDFGLRPWTPGTSNQTGAATVATYKVPNVDAVAAGTAVTDMGYTFRPPIVIDPADATTQVDGVKVNPNAIPASPQGGKAVVMWDYMTGGGNTAISKDLMKNAGGFDLWVYLDTSFANWGTDTGWETTSYGAMGTTDTNYNSPDPDATMISPTTVNPNGNTGLCWVFNKYRTSTASVCKLYLCDAGAGGDSSPPSSPWVVQQTIDLTAQPSGWYRLSIAYDGTTGNATAVFGSQTFNFTTATGLSGEFYVGYREAVTAQPAYLRPATFDTVP
jgi:hypothetical protein